MAKKKSRLKIKNIIFLLILLFIICIAIYKIVTHNDFVVNLKTTTFEIGEEYTNDFSATYKGEDVTDKVKVTHNIYSNAVGKYQVVFSYTVENKEFKVTKTIEIKDETKPVIKLKNGENIIVILGDKFNEPGYTATDDYDGDITSNVKVSGDVDTDKEGTYTLKYTVTDSSDNKSVVKRKVTVTTKSPLTMSVKDFNLTGYFTDVLLSETDDAGEDYTDKFIFVGDSTALYYVMNKVITGKQLWHKEGVSLETIFTQNIYINHIESKLTLLDAMEKNKPAKILLSLGRNSVSTMEIDYFIGKYEELLNDMMEASPNTLIIVQSIFPVAASLDEAGKGLNNDKINKMNYRLLELCSKLDIPFLNTAEVLKDANGQLKDGYYRTSANENGVHLSEEGNKIAMQYFKTHAYEN
jgi:hypothetical protein